MRSHLHDLRATVHERLLARDACGAWSAIEALAEAVQRPDVPLRAARAHLLACLETLEFAPQATGLDRGDRLADARVVGLLIDAPCRDDLVTNFLHLAYAALRPSLLNAYQQRDAAILQAIARTELRTRHGVQDVIQTVAANLLDEPEPHDPSERLDQRLQSEVAREAYNHARRRHRREARSVPHDDVAAFLGVEPSQHSEVTMAEVDELAAAILSPKRYAVYEIRRRGCDTAEIADALGIAPRTVRHRWREACEQLRDALK